MRNNITETLGSERGLETRDGASAPVYPAPDVLRPSPRVFRGKVGFFRLGLRRLPKNGTSRPARCVYPHSPIQAVFSHPGNQWLSPAEKNGKVAAAHLVGMFLA